MRRGTAILIILVLGSVMTMLAQKRPYDVIMKEINTTYASLKRNLDSNTMTTAVEDATKLQGLFKETEDFWAPFKTKDALDAAGAAKMASEAIAKAAAEGNGQKAQAAYGSIGKSCKGCHDSHRELMPDKSYRIKP